MRVHRIIPVVAALATVGFAGDLWAQEKALPPVTAESPDLEGQPRNFGFTPDRGTCFYNWQADRYQSLLNNSAIGGEIQEMGRGWLTACSPTYGIHLGHIAGPWAYMLLDGPAYPDRANLPTLEQVEAIKRASLEAAGGNPTRPAPGAGHAPVPEIGDGYGAGELMTQTLELRVAPSQGPPTYRGAPVLEPGRSWVRAQRPDGTRPWREIRPQRADYTDRALGLRYTPQNRGDFGPTAQSRAAYRNTRMQSFNRSADSTRPAAVSAPTPSRPATLKSPRKGKVEQ